MKLPAFRAADEDTFAAAGGLDLTSPQLTIKPGHVIGALNYEVSNIRGYQRLEGYERRDGRPRPSAASYEAVAVAATFDASVVVGDTINGQTSGATGKVIYVDPGRAWLIVTRRNGSFFTGTENLRKGVTVVGVQSTANLPAITQEMDNDFRDLAAADYRADIQAVPGSGPVRGVWSLNNQLYAVRDNAGGTAGVVHRSTAAGWVAVALNEQVAFTNANVDVNEGDVLTQGGVTSTILRVVVRTGTLLSGTNSGVLIISSRLGGNYAAGAASATGGGTLTLGGAQTAITLPPGGKYRTVTHNFTGSTNTRRIYGANGVGNGFEFDGTVWVPVVTGMAVDTPSQVIVHKNHLFYSFLGSVQFSGPAAPYVWSVVVGAGEIGVGDEVTGFVRGPGSELTSALFIFSKDQTGVLYGKSSAEFTLDILSDSAGAVRDTARRVFYPVTLDIAGMVAVPSTDVYGNFEQDAVISEKFKPLVDSLLPIAVDSMRIKGRRQYKLFASDGRGLTVTFDSQGVLGALPFRYPFVVSCTWSGEENNEDVAYVGATDGFVYELNRGRSFDGAAFDWYLRFAFTNLRSPMVNKHMQRAFVEMKTQSFGRISFGYELSYAQSDRAQSPAQDSTLPGMGGRFDESNFEAIFFDSPEFIYSIFKLDGDATNISYVVGGRSAKEAAHTVFGITTHYRKRRQMRSN